MNEVQEEAFYEFLMEHKEPFTIKEVSSFVRSKDSSHYSSLSTEIVKLINSHRLAFDAGPNKWVTRVGCFSGAKFVIRPSKDEIANGILIPGHRFIPFGNPALQQKDYRCIWNGIEVPRENTEASPEDLSPYYSLYGDEFLPQYLARENKTNENAYNNAIYDEPDEVNISTFNLSVFYRETGFVPGDLILLTVTDWRNVTFSIERQSLDDWSKDELLEWKNTAEAAFCASFNKMGACANIEEQIAWAYYLGGARIKNVPAWPLDYFLFEISDRVEAVPFGIETRFWFAGREIPDYTSIKGIQTQSDQTALEKILFAYNIPVSEFVVQAYIYDALYRKETNFRNIIERIIPGSVKMSRWKIEIIAGYILEAFNLFKQGYSVFKDRLSGPIRRRASDLHTAIIDLASRLLKGDFDKTWLPKHTFVTLSQIQGHIASVLEDVYNDDKALTEDEAFSVESSLEGMTETFDEIREAIESSLDNYRHSNISLVHSEIPPELIWRMVQISIGGIAVWRRVVLPQTLKLNELHKIIQSLFGWNELYAHRFSSDVPCKAEFLDEEKKLKEALCILDLSVNGLSEVNYEYGTFWNIKIIIMVVHNAVKNEVVRCIDGENAPPPETLEGPVCFRRLIDAIDSTMETERKYAKLKLGSDFNVNYFDINECNQKIESVVKNINGDKI
ncbi:MAG: hypothetical protein Pg6A_01920 [Termitinemataceae bacterium]|nr:MAG: hypothetical protein Pg6A_01920 [Termitinemataceae bacterium]